MLGNWVTDHLDRDGTDYPFRRIDSLLQQADVRFANLEAPIGTGDSLSRYDKTYTFTLPSSYRQVLKHSRLDIAGLANNHIMDYGVRLADSTVYYLKELGIRSVGYGLNRREASQPVVLPGNPSVAFLAYSMTFPREFWATDSTAGTAYPFESDFIPRVTAADSLADFTIVSFHWGSENSDSTKKYQQVFARRAIDAGADLVVGHHPHIWQGIENYKGRLIAYSLGNFCFGSFSPTALRSGLLEIEIGEDTVRAAKIHPLNVKNVDVRFQPRLMTARQADSFFTHLRTISSRFDSTSTIQIHPDGNLSWDRE
ncbi:MAG: CapA family protein [Candidatus Marinimicrobia bacterium]|nr:CapA family protein [Candidatus Neomarinimicrobiota bacterium]MCF7828936.1 CapA family protein [Candidatus Neomarinimicrobiota bacterium]MCF7879896.1 CapA family protein [Candidatus Neomarinimicrobiota bacterium]